MYHIEDDVLRYTCIVTALNSGDFIKKQITINVQQSYLFNLLVADMYQCFCHTETAGCTETTGDGAQISSTFRWLRFSSKLSLKRI